MCMMVYIAADTSLPIIEWQYEKSVFSVTELLKGEECVRKQFTKSFVYYLGSYEGCGCGFSYGDEYGDEPIEDEDDLKRDIAARESVRQLSEYLSYVVKSGLIELYACWDGDQEANVEERLNVTPAYFGGESFAFEEKQFLEVQCK